MLRVQVPDIPGTLGLVATAMGTVNADIAAVEIVEKGPGYAIDDFILTLPPSTLPDTLVSTCDMLDGVKVLWLSRYPENWGIESDIATLNRMADDPEHGAEILTEATPVVFHCQWAALFSADREVLTSTALAPEFTVESTRQLEPFDQPHSIDLTDGWMDGWGDTVVAVAPLAGGRGLALGRQGGPTFLGSELNRLKHLAALAN
ncbi:amino acid-binding protein [Acidipropionibacterium virtanenii]|uniref:ACT domain-containing protein n=1 Tax=Acidipropionibacterium virtanenii TaxID=2057246 RepID=A0A344UTZ4_9ACTN|nr:amino acid-binding protein [Acidipropionibacterium virtanenii]AXE38742.1 hypothetical protein JS278_01578 [Acidipropionibacterium virtanenii]